MIDFKHANKYCCEDICLIKNYEAALNDKTQTWDIHHLLETDLDLSKDELIKQNKYFKVPASELIFLTRAEHNILHNSGKHLSDEIKQKLSESGKKFFNNGGTNWIKGKHHSDETKKKQSEKMKGEKNPSYGRVWMNNGYARVYIKNQKEIEHYLELGYHFGWKFKQKADITTQPTKSIRYSF